MNPFGLCTFHLLCFVSVCFICLHQRTPLKLAVEGAHNKVVECLQRAGVKRLDVSIQDQTVDRRIDTGDLL